MNRILRRIAKDLDLNPAEGALRANLVASQISGLIMVRYIIKIEPLASAHPETIVALIGPTIQHYISGPLSTPTRTAPQDRHDHDSAVAKRRADSRVQCNE